MSCWVNNAVEISLQKRLPIADGRNIIGKIHIKITQLRDSEHPVVRL